MNRITSFCLFLLAILLFSSCEYPNNGNYFKEIEKPAPEHLFKIELNADTSNFVVFKPSHLSFNLDAMGLDLDMYNNSGSKDGCKMTLGNQELPIYQDGQSNFKYYTYIYPGSFSEGKHTLTLYLKTKNSGSGSIADKLGLEYYTATKTWNVKVADYSYRGTDMMPLSQKVSSDGFLELYWEKPNSLQSELLGYRVRWYDTFIGSSRDTLISGADNTSFIDKNYTCSGIDYVVFAVIKGFNDDPNDSWSDNTKFKGRIRINEPEPSITMIKDNFNGTITAFWTKGKYKASYVLSKGYNGPEKVYCESDTFATIQGPDGIFYNYTYYLNVFPYHQGKDNDYFYNYTTFNFSYGIQYSPNYPNILGYNKKENTLIVSTNNNNINLFQLPAGTLLKNTYKIQDYSPILSTPTNSSKIALLGREEIILFKDFQLNEELSIYVGPSTALQYLKITDNNVLILGRTTFENSKNMLNLNFYNENNGNLIKTLQLELNFFIDNNTIDISQDGKHLAISLDNKMTLYDISGNEIKQLQVENKNFSKVCFNPFYSNILALVRYGYIELRETPSFKLLHSIKTQNQCNLLNIDPLTGNLAVVDNSDLLIINTKTAEIIQRFNYGYYVSKLYGNVLFSYDGQMYDLTKQLSK